MITTGSALTTERTERLRQCCVTATGAQALERQKHLASPDNPGRTARRIDTKPTHSGVVRVVLRQHDLGSGSSGGALAEREHAVHRSHVVRHDRQAEP